MWAKIHIMMLEENLFILGSAPWNLSSVSDPGGPMKLLRRLLLSQASILSRSINLHHKPVPSQKIPKHLAYFLWCHQKTISAFPLREASPVTKGTSFEIGQIQVPLTVSKCEVWGVTNWLHCNLTHRIMTTIKWEDRVGETSTESFLLLDTDSEHCFQTRGAGGIWEVKPKAAFQKEMRSDH